MVRGHVNRRISAFGGLLAALAACVAFMMPAPASAQLPALPNLLGTITQPLCAPLQGLAGQLSTIQLAGPLVQTSADLVCALGSAQYAFETTYDPPGAAPPIKKTFTAIVQVPTSMDVDNDGTPDVRGTIQVVNFSPISVQLKIEKIGGPAQMPLKVEAVVALPDGGGRTAAVGYDALGSTAPGNVTVTGGFNGPTTNVTMNTAGAPPSVDVIAELFSGTSAARSNRQAGRVGFAPVPASLQATITGDPDATQVSLLSSEPSKVDVDYLDETGTNDLNVSATVDKLPTSASVEFSDGPQGMSGKYRGSAAIDDVDASLRETNGNTIVTDAKLNLEDLPTEIDITQPGPDSVKVVANNPVGVAEGGFATGGEVELLDSAANPAYANIVDNGGVSSKALRALGVSNAEANLGNTLSLNATLASSPFRLRVVDGNLNIDGRILNLPSQIGLVYDPADGKIDYTANAPIGEISVDANDPDGLLARATDVDLRVLNLPQALTLEFGQDGDTVIVDAHGGEVGQIEVEATNGPAANLIPGQDGIKLRDIEGGDFVLAGRLTGLRKARVDMAPDPDLDVDAGGNQVLNVDVRTQATGQEEIFMTAKLDTLKPNTKIQVRPQGVEGSKIHYEAAAPATKLDFSSNGDDESDFMVASLEPVPQTLDLCSSEDTACNTTNQASNGGAVRFDASSPTKINMFTCELPLTGCTEGNADASMKIVNMTAQTVGLDVNVGGPTDVRVFFDTDNRDLHGQLIKKLDNPVVKGLNVNLPVGFRAQNRLVRVPGSETVCVPFVGCSEVPTPLSVSGSITCPGGTDFDVDLINPLPTVDVGFLIC